MALNRGGIGFVVFGLLKAVNWLMFFIFVIVYTKYYFKGNFA
jgi:hypothetical protein